MPYESAAADVEARVAGECSAHHIIGVVARVVGWMALPASLHMHHMHHMLLASVVGQHRV